MKKLIALLTVGALVAASCGKKKADPAAGSGSETGSGSATTGPVVLTPAPDDPARDAVAAASGATVALFASAKTPNPGARTGQLVDRLVEANQTVPRTWDPATVIAAVGKDRGALFKWVRDQTALVPYRGALRGSIGVMMDRTGNSLDRALLLADLLKLAGLQARLANATLPADVQQRLATSWTKRPRLALPAGGLDDAALEAKLVKDFAVDPAAFAERSAKTAAAAKTLAAALRARIATQTKDVAALVPASGTPATPPASFEDHWWVQVDDEGVWQDLDPSLGDAEPGQALAAAGETVDPAALAEQHRHTLTIRVVGEIWKDNAREETTLLEHTLVPANYYGQPIVVTNVPIDVPDQDALLASKDRAAAARAALLTETEWIPIVRIGKSVVAKMSVTDGGELFDVSAPDANTTRLARAVQRATKQGVGGADDLLNTLPSDGSSDPAALPARVEHSAFTAEWIELERRAPGEPPAITRRLVFDVLGARGDRSAARPAKLADATRVDRGLALGGQTDILPVFARIPRAFIVDRAVKVLVEARPSLVELANLGMKEPGPELRDRLLQLSSLPGPLYDLALARFELSAVGDQVYLDRLAVFARHQHIATTPSGYVMRDGIDIVANSVGVWPANARDPRAVRIAQGVADTVAESGILSCTARTGCVRSANASEDFATSGGKGWRVIAAASPGRGSAEIASDLAAAYTIVRGPAETWWRVDPRTGETLGMSVRGGAVTTEYALKVNMVTATAGAGGCLYQDGTRAGGAGSPHTRSYWACMAGVLLGFALGGAILPPGGTTATVEGGAAAARGLSMVISLFGALWGPLTTPRPHPHP